MGLAALIALVVVLPFQPATRPAVADYTFEFEAASSVDGMAQLFYDVGGGFNEAESSRVTLSAGAERQLYRFRITSGRYRALRFDPLDRPGQVTLADLLIRDDQGGVVHRFEPTALRPQNHIASLRIDGPLIHLDTGPTGVDPDLLVDIPPDFALSDHAFWSWWFYLGSALAVALLILGLQVGLRRLLRRPPTWFVRLRTGCHAHPIRLVAAVALVAVMLSTYPVVFAGRSFVTPNYGSVLLYEDWPTVPGSKDAGSAVVGASDVGAIMWQHVPYSMLQHDALFQHLEWPLWNRYNSSGLPLLGQGQSSFGDPFHLLPILFRGAAWAWDLKFLTAKFLFAFGLGLLVWEMARHRPAALIVAAVSPFIGFFLYRINHPAFFSLSYGPWILYFSWRIAQADRPRQLALAALGLILANTAELTSGTVKEAYLLLFSLNLAGTLVIALQPDSWRLTRLRLTTFVIAGLTFVALTAPVWMTLWHTLSTAYSSYDARTAYQLPPGLLLGVFDEIYLRPFQHRQQVYNGSLNLVLLLGLVWALLRARTLLRDRLVLALTLACLPPAVFAFGVVPPAWIVRVPFLGNVAHLDNSFLCALFILGSVLAGYGWREAWARLASPHARGDLLSVGVLLGLLAALYLGSLQAVQRSHRSFLYWGESFPASTFAGWYTLSLAIGVVLLLGALWHWRQRGAGVVVVSLAVLGTLLLVWRFSWHVGAGWPDFVVNARARPDFSVHSPAVAAAKADRPEPFRAVGFGGNLFPGWTAAEEIESISSPDALMSPYYRQVVESTGLERLWDWRILTTRESFLALRPVYDFLGVRHVFDLRSDAALLGQSFEPLHRGDLDVYRNPSAWPRAFFTDRVIEYETPADFARLVRQGDGRPFAAMVAGERRASPAAALRQTARDRTVSPARQYRLTTNRTGFTVDAARAGLVVLQETYWPDGFIATVNGRRAEVLRVNHAFKGVAVPAAGTYDIRFQYRPRHFLLALGLAGLGLALAVGLGVIGFRRPAMVPPP
jgi:hypothetical protein